MNNSDMPMFIGGFGGLFMGAWLSDTFGVSFVIGWIVSSLVLYMLAGAIFSGMIAGLDNAERTRITSSQRQIKSEAKEDRINAAQQLGKSGSPRAVISLIAALDDPDSQVQDAAHAALVNVTGHDLHQDTAAWKRWWRENRDTFAGR